jgi:hypothetical protein
MGFYDDLRNAYDTYNRLNASERDTLKDILWANPGHLTVLKAAKAEAERWSRNLAMAGLDALPEDQQEARFRASLRDGPADAARHCYWSALLSSKLAYNDAMRVVFTHEFDDMDSGEVDRQLAARMDLHNDRVGLEIGTRMKGAGDVDLEVEVLKALFAGRLVHIDRATKSLVPTKSLTNWR